MGCGIGSDDWNKKRDELHERFRLVIIKAGYAHPESILAEYFDKYMENVFPEDVPKFEAMLKSYEDDEDGDPE